MRRITLGYLVKQARGFVDGRSGEISGEIRQHLPNPIVDRDAYFAQTDQLCHFFNNLGRSLKARGKKITVKALGNEVDAELVPPSETTHIDKNEGHSSTLGWWSRKGGI